MTAIPITLSFDSEALPPGPPGLQGPPGLDGNPGQPGIGLGISVVDHGAVGDGVADDTAAFNEAIAEALTLGKQAVFVPGRPAGQFYRLTARVDWPSSLSIVGDGAHVTYNGVSGAPNTPDGGSWIKFDHSGEGFFLRNDAVVGARKMFCRMRGLGFMREQPAPGSGWAPAAHSHDLRIEWDCHLDDITFLNPTKAALIRSGGLLQCRNVRGQPLSIGFECERATDVQRWTDIHWWPYWSQNANVVGYTIPNADAFKIRRADGLNVTNAFGIYYRRLFHFQDAAGDLSGAANFNLVNVYADHGGGLLEIHGDNYSSFGTVTNAFQNSDNLLRGTGPGIGIYGAVGASIDLINYRCHRANDEGLLVSGPHQIRAHVARIAGWGINGGGESAIKADTGTIRLTTLPEFGSASLNYQQTNGGKIYLPTVAQVT